jgi:hypothetical protein
MVLELLQLWQFRNDIPHPAIEALFTVMKKLETGSIRIKEAFYKGNSS